jgi:iron complex outermembrane recepter protein
MTRPWWCYTVLFGWMCAQYAAAQTAAVGETAAPASSPMATDTTRNGGLEEIVVTAERHEQSAQSAPLTIEVVGGEALQNSGISNVNGLQMLTTGLDFGQTGSSEQLFIRGVGDLSINQLANPGVAFNVDGIYVGRPDGLGGNLYDLARVEVLKGPQGTLYGRNANGGSINVITNAPKLGEDSIDLSVEAGNYSLTHTSGAANVALTGDSALRAAFNVVHRDGYLSDGTDDDLEQSMRVRYRWEPSSDLSLLLNSDYTHLGGEGGGYAYLPIRPGASPWEGVGSPAAIAYRDSLPPFGPLNDPLVPHPSQNSYLKNASAQVDWKFSFATLTLLPAFRDTDIESDAYPGFFYGSPQRDHQTSFEARLGNSSSQLTWVVGAYYYRELVNGQLNIFESNILQNTQFLFQPTTDADAVFGQTTWEVVDGLRLIAGARETDERRSLDGTYIDNRPPPFGAGPGAVLESFGSHVNFNGFTYKAGLEYDIAPENLVYLTSSSGFKAGGLNSTVPPEAVYHPEKLYSWELGTHNRFLDHRLQVNASIFDWKYKNLQDQRVTFDPLGIVNVLFFNVGDAMIKGATFDIITKPFESDTVSASLEYADSYYDSFSVKVPTALFLPGSIGCPTREVGSESVSNCAGYSVARVPRWNGTLRYTHDFALPGGAAASFESDGKFETRRYLGTDFIPAENSPSYFTFDLNFMFRPASGRYAAGIFVRNVADRAYYTGGFQQPFSPGLFAANIAAPRTFGFHGEVHFGR